MTFAAFDLTDCAREPIHIPGSIQPHGCLLAMEPGDLRIVHAAGDTPTLLGAQARELLGARFAERIGPRLTAAVKGPPGGAAPGRRLLDPDLAAAQGGVSGEGAVHACDGLLVLELEPRTLSEAPPGDTFGLVQNLIGEVREARSSEDFLHTLATSVRRVSGFDRVMIYRFLADGSGAVEAEARAPAMPSYLGLRYPASDIPAQARELYRRNTLRLIPDAHYVPAPLLTAPGWPASRPLDLSDSLLRSVSPLHLEYLANMGVVGSMSISIILEGRLWGLIACHHRQPRFLPQRLRLALDLFGQMASFQLETRLAAEALSERTAAGERHRTLVEDLAGEADVLESLRRSTRRLLDYLPAGGLAVRIDGRFAAVGATPREGELSRLVNWLGAQASGGVFHTDRLAEHYPPAQAFADVASGMLALPISRTPRDYLIWFRPEQIQTIDWAGNPDKAAGLSDQAPRLSPRRSFAAWREQVRGRAAPWSAEDVRLAEALRVSLLEVVLEHVDQLARERQSARIQQDALLAQLDDRIAQWERTAAQLKVESDRRAIVEDELSQVLRRTVTEQEAERQRIARELHDSLGQYLTAMKMDLDGIARDASASATVRARVERLRTLTDDAGQEVNHLAWEIRPTALDDLGLQTALQQLIEEWGERSGLAFDLHLTLEHRRLNPAVESVLYRVLQEAILNVVKHARASRVGVILEAGETEVRLIVEDDGQGFVWTEGAAAVTSRLGLLGMRERLALVGGALEIESAVGLGTTLLIHVPLIQAPLIHASPRAEG